MTKKQKPKRSWKMWALIWPDNHTAYVYQDRAEAARLREKLSTGFAEVDELFKIKQVTVTEGWE